METQSIEDKLLFKNVFNAFFYRKCSFLVANFLEKNTSTYFYRSLEKLLKENYVLI